MKSAAARRIVWCLAVVFSALGMWVSMHMALDFYRVSAPGKESGLLEGVCIAAGDTFKHASCEKVSKSRWGWFPPLPDQKAKNGQKQALEEWEKADEKQANDNPFAAGKSPAPAPQPTTQPASAKQQAGQQTAEKDEDKRYPGVPTGQLGLIYFTFVFCWFVFASPVRSNRFGAFAILLVVAILGLLGSAVYEYIMWTQMDDWCPLCVIAHALSLLILVCVLLLWPHRPGMPAAATAAEPTPSVDTPSAGEPEPSETTPTAPPSTGLFAPVPERRPVVTSASTEPWPTTRIIGMTLVIALTSIVAQHFYIQKGAKTYPVLEKNLEIAKAYREYYEKRFKSYDRHWQMNFYSWLLSPQVNIPIEGRPQYGPADAPHTLVIFSDFECPGCKQIAEHIHNHILPMSQKYGGLKMVFKHWPICKDCNDVMQGPTKHPKACGAAYAAEAAKIVGGDEAFWKMHDLLFARQDEWKKTGEFVEYARQLGLDVDEFKRAFDSPEVKANVLQDARDGHALGEGVEDKILAGETRVESTPSLFIDGRKLTNPSKARTWQTILQTRPMQTSPSTGEAQNSQAPQAAPAPQTNYSQAPQVTHPPALQAKPVPQVTPAPYSN